MMRRTIAMFVLVMLAWAGSPARGQSAATGNAPATQPVSPSDVESMSLLQLLLKGGWFMAPIGAASLVGLALILERLLALRKRRVLPRGFLRRLEQLGSDAERAEEYARRSDSAAGRVASAGLARVNTGVALVERAMSEAGTQEIHRLRKNVRMLYGVSAVAPMLGLLGTVSGMIEAFRVTSVSKGLGKPELLAAGIYEALVATLAGLMVAIPTLVCYYYCIGRIEQAVADLNDVASQVIRQFFEAPRKAPGEVELSIEAAEKPRVKAGARGRGK